MRALTLVVAVSFLAVACGGPAMEATVRFDRPARSFEVRVFALQVDSASAVEEVLAAAEIAFDGDLSDYVYPAVMVGYVESGSCDASVHVDRDGESRPTSVEILTSKSACDDSAASRLALIDAIAGPLDQLDLSFDGEPIAVVTELPAPCCGIESDG
jgi:hypothetical protein